ncbi:MAG TPA: DUF4157 domain-containing protein [Chthoniobacteraceae bacterium]|jgi:hypothetical protein|nr:DUF4157 domain-containing protein [Chthoniobacteraceae bacterium]
MSERPPIPAMAPNTRSRDGSARPGLLHRRATEAATSTMAPPIVDEVLRSPGRPLPSATRAFMESRFDHDFSHTRVHTGPRAAESASAIGAEAYTVGRQMVFGEGRYAPETASGKHLLAHELAHVVQQSDGETPPGSALRVDASTSQFEAEADRAAEQVSSGARSPSSLRTARPQVNRKPLPQTAAEDAAAVQAAYKAAVNASNWKEVAERLNGFNEAEIETKLGQFKHDQLIEIHAAALEGVGWGEIATVTAKIAKLDTEAARVGKLTFDYNSARRAGRWKDAAEFLKIFNDADIRLKVGKLASSDLLSLKAGSIQAVPPDGDGRVVKSIKEVLSEKATMEAEKMIGQSMTWVPSGPGSVNTFATWASAPTEAAAPPVSPSTTINCWEMVLLAAHRAQVTTWDRIHKIYTVPPFDIVKALSGGSPTTYNPGSPTTPRPSRGDITFFNGAAHVALANGVTDMGNRSQIISFWPPPDVMGGSGTVDKVKVTTVEDLNDFWVRRHPPFLITFAKPSW